MTPTLRAALLGLGALAVAFIIWALAQPRQIGRAHV